MRKETIEQLSATPFDVLVIGGGITGAGVARDAAMRGLTVALVEKNDFASGTSSRSSRLVHGGVRYLENAQLHLVFESSRERRILLRIAPNIVRPLRFTWPVYKGARVARWKLGIGLALYDALSLFRNVGRHVRLSARAVATTEPALERSGLRGGAHYWDAATDDVRLTLATVLSAEQCGAVVINHAMVVSLLLENGTVIGARVEDRETRHVFDVKARVVVNATGPWSNSVAALAGGVTPPGVQGSKGVHIMVPQSRVANNGALTLIAPQDGRVMFVLPAGDFTIIGTTDTFEDANPDDVRASEDDVVYLLDAANHYFPAARLRRADVVSAWAGLRPLAHFGDQPATPGAVSREHAITEPVPRFLRVTGGKLTTSRAMAEEVVDMVQRALGTDVTPSRTGVTALENMAGVGASIQSDSQLGQRIVPERPYLVAALYHAIRQEHARTLGDLLIRRVPIAFETVDHGANAAAAVAGLVGSWLGWNDRAVNDALAAYAVEIDQMFSVME